MLSMSTAAMMVTRYSLENFQDLVEGRCLHVDLPSRLAPVQMWGKEMMHNKLCQEKRGFVSSHVNAVTQRLRTT